ncbi:MAG: 6-phosphogluconolactonase [Candidatus Meridianibacter frigidus]|nr:MAG: 6-phosphogluconolactonase [Candidatus Eremiobacteraeota bacterium]
MDGARSKIEVFDNPETLAAAIADLFVDCAQTATTERGGFYVALSGGRTPTRAYELLAQEPRTNAVPWKDVFIYFGDERCVPPDDEQSNYLLAKQSFLDRVQIPLGNVHRMRGEEQPDQAAAGYQKILIEDMGADPRFDLVLLGLGLDGHTASLFPGNPLTAETFVEAPYVPKFSAHRITLTPRVINRARRIAVAVEGIEKAEILASVLDKAADPAIYPIALVLPTDGELTWLVDRAAASSLQK